MFGSWPSFEPSKPTYFSYENFQKKETGRKKQNGQSQFSVGRNMVTRRWSVRTVNFWTIVVKQAKRTVNN